MWLPRTRRGHTRNVASGDTRVPELPDVTIYIEALERQTKGRVLNEIRLFNPFLLRTVEPPVDAVKGRTVTDLRRIGKRIAIGFDSGVWLALHLMIAGRLRWRDRGIQVPRKHGLAEEFPNEKEGWSVALVPLEDIFVALTGRGLRDG